MGCLLLNKKVCALHDGHDRDERSDTHGQSQDCERSTQFVPAQGTEALGKIVADGEHGGRENWFSYPIESCEACIVELPKLVDYL